MPTFREAGATCFAENRETWNTESPARNCRSAMDRYVLPKIGGVPVDRVGSAAVNEVLRPVALIGKHAMVKMGGGGLRHHGGLGVGADRGVPGGALAG